MRGPIAPPQVPLATSRADAFVDLVHDSVQRLERRWPQLADIEFTVRDVPPAAPPGEARDADGFDDGVPLGRLATAVATLDAIAAGSGLTYLGVFDSNLVARRMYEDLGYVMIGGPSPDLILR